MSAITETAPAVQTTQPEATATPAVVAATQPEVTTPVVTTTVAAPGASPVLTAPSMKSLPQTQTSYAMAMTRLVNEFEGAYLTPDMTPEQQAETLQSVADTTTMFRGLCDKHLMPIFQELENQLTKPRPVAVAKAHKALTDWQIFLKYAKDRIPGYAASNQKMNLAKGAYHVLTDQEKSDLRQQYYAANPQAAAAVTSAPSTKKRNATGFSLFSKAWYEAFKKENPGASGLQSKACGAAWKALPADQQGQWKAAATAQSQ